MEIYNLYCNENLTIEEISKKLNKSISTIHRNIKKMNLKKTAEQQKQIENNRAQKIKNSWKKVDKQILKEKKIDTCLKKYGTKCTFQNQEIKNKIQDTIIKKYGVNNCMKNKEIANKMVNSKTPEIKQQQVKKAQQTMLEKYGVKCNLILQKIKNIIKNKYNVNNIAQKNIKNYKEWENKDLFIAKCKEFKNTDLLCNYFNVKKANVCRHIIQMEARQYIDSSRSKYEIELLEFVKSVYSGEVICNTKEIISPLELDIYIPEKKLAIEFNGDYWHCSEQKDKFYHFNKFKSCYDKGIRLIQIWEHQWQDERLKPILQSIIKNALGIVENQVYARECKVKELTKEVAKEFCEREHIQGWRSAKDLVCYGLYKGDTLLQISSFGKSSYGKSDWEWVRGCIASNNKVVGGTSKLLKHFIKEKEVESILCYADANVFDGNGYKASGFVLDDFTKYDKFYLNENGERVNRTPSKYSEYMEKVKSGEWLLCYGAGSLRFMWRAE